MSRSSRDRDDAGTVRPNDHDALREVREQAREAKRQVRQELIQTRAVSDETKIQAAEVALDYRDLLIDYRPDIGMDVWESRNVDWPLDLVGQMVEREQPAPGVGRGTETVDRPAFVEVNGHRFYKLIKHLDQMWRLIGMGAETPDEDLDTYQVGGDEPQRGDDGGDHGSAKL